MIGIDLPSERDIKKMRQMRKEGVSYRGIWKRFDKKYSHAQIRAGCGINRKIIAMKKERLGWDNFYRLRMNKIVSY